MKDFLVKNFEKVLLTALLLVLAICSVLQILSMDRNEIDVLPPKEEGFFVKMPPIPSIQDTQVSLKENVMQPFDSSGYIFCRKLECKFLMRNTETKCPWCGTDTKPVERVPSEEDSDNDGISNKVEIQYGMNPNDPKDANTDLDEDGFSNIDEIKAKNSPIDAADHPLVIKRSYLRGVKNEYYNLRIATMITGDYQIGSKAEDLKKDTWEIYMDVVVKGRVKSRYFKINDSDDDLKFKVIDLGVENDKPYALVKFEDAEEPVKFFESKRPKVKSVLYYFYNELNKKYYSAELGKVFYLEDLKGVKEKYKLDKYIQASGSAIVTAYKTSQKVTVGRESELKAPGSLTDPGTDLERLEDVLPEF